MPEPNFRSLRCYRDRGLSRRVPTKRGQRCFEAFATDCVRRNKRLACQLVFASVPDLPVLVWFLQIVVVAFQYPQLTQQAILLGLTLSGASKTEPLFHRSLYCTSIMLRKVCILRISE